MAKSKIILKKGKLIDYQSLIEEVVGMFLAENMNYVDDYKNIKKFANDNNWPYSIDRDRAYLLGDADYEITIKKKRKKRA